MTQDLEHACHVRVTSFIQLRSCFQGQTQSTTVDDDPSEDSSSPWVPKPDFSSALVHYANQSSVISD